MVRQSVERCGYTHYTRCTDNYESDQEQDSGDLLDHPSADELAHISDTVAAGMVGLELSLNEGTPSVQELPAKHVDGTREGSESEHGRRDGKDTGREDDCTEF